MIDVRNLCTMTALDESLSTLRQKKRGGTTFLAKHATILLLIVV